MAVLEAWSWGTPALITRACNLPEGIARGAALEITTEPSSIARVILQFATQSLDERRAMSDAGRRLVDTQFHAREIARQLEMLYMTAAAGETMPPELIFA